MLIKCKHIFLKLNFILKINFLFLNIDPLGGMGKGV
jgi:hypothetical protein